MVKKESGERALLEGLSMRLHDKEDTEDLLGKGLRSVALRAAAKHLLEHDKDPCGNGDYRLTKVLRHYHRFDSAVSTIVKFLCDPFLTRDLLQGEIKDYKRFGVFEGSSHFENPLSLIEPTYLIAWCAYTGEASAWSLVARAISPFGSSRDGGIDHLTEQGLALITASPNPVEVLSVFVEHIAPMSWSGSRANIVGQRITALEEISEAAIPGVAENLAEVVPKLRKMEQEERDREAKRARDDEQRFE